MQDYEPVMMMRAYTNYNVLMVVFFVVAASAVVMYTKNAKQINIAEDNTYGQQTLAKPLLEDEDSVHILGNGRKARFL